MRHNHSRYDERLNPTPHPMRVEPPPPRQPGDLLPAAIDRSLFDPDQLAYLEDTYHELAVTYIENQLTLVRYTPNLEPTLEEITLNIAILCKLYRLTPELARLPWDTMAATFHIANSSLYARKNALLRLLKQFDPKNRRPHT